MELVTKYWDGLSQSARESHNTICRMLGYPVEQSCNYDHRYIVGGVVFFIASYVFAKQRRAAAAAAKKKGIGRRMRSTTIGVSSLMVAGSLPDAVDRSNFDNVIGSRMDFECLPEMKAVEQLFLEHIIPHMRFHCVPMQQGEGGKVLWVPRRVTMQNHFHCEELEHMDLISDRLDEIINTPLTTKAKDAPWWEVHRISVKNSTRGVLLIRIHHAIGDGVSLMEMFSDAVTDASGNKIDMSSLFNPARYQQKSRPPSIARSVKKVLMVPLIGLDVMRSVWKFLRVTLLAPDTPCAYQDEARQLPFRTNRFTVYFPSHSVKLIKQIKEKLSQQLKTNITINDVEFALFAGAIRRYSLASGEDPNKLSLRALTAVALPEQCDPLTKHATLLRNNFCLIANQLPVTSKDAKTRIADSHKTWDIIKTTTVVPVSFYLCELFSTLPVAVLRNTFAELATRCSTVFSNVPGPSCPLFLCGKEVKSTHMLFPNVSQQVGILSVNGTLHMALVMATHVDKNQTKALLPKFFMEELLDAAACVGISKEEVEQNVEFKA